MLAEDDATLAKLNEKYVAFGEVEQGWEVLDRLNAVGGGGDGKSREPVWIGSCGKC